VSVPSAGRPSVEVEVDRWGDLPLLRLAGELDHHAAGSLREEVQKVLLQEETLEAGGEGGVPARGLVLDMDQLSYIDSGGLALLFDIARTFDEQGQGHFLNILKPNSHVLRLLNISGLHELPAIRMIVEGDEPALTTGESGS
jgi:anti-anti-sigma factor